MSATSLGPVCDKDSVMEFGFTRRCNVALARHYVAYRLNGHEREMITPLPSFIGMESFDYVVVWWFKG